MPYNYKAIRQFWRSFGKLTPSQQPSAKKAWLILLDHNRISSCLNRNFLAAELPLLTLNRASTLARECRRVPDRQASLELLHHVLVLRQLDDHDQEWVKFPVA